MSLESRVQTVQKSLPLYPPRARKRITFHVEHPPTGLLDPPEDADSASQALEKRVGPSPGKRIRIRQDVWTGRAPEEESDPIGRQEFGYVAQGRRLNA